MKINYFNYYEIPKLKNEWFFRFFKHRNIADSKTLNFYSAFGPRIIYFLTRRKYNFFFSGENLNFGKHKRYKDYLLHSGISLSLGFDFINSPNYLRFPLWILYLIQPHDTYLDIKEKIKNIEKIKKEQRNKFACLVSSHDKNGLRSKIFNQLNQIEKVLSGGHLLMNDNALKLEFRDNKIEYLKQFKFNICPENSNSTGYVTEKIFQALEAGCIPIYWGSDNNPEPEILNPNAILFWDPLSDNSELLSLIDNLNSDKNLYNDFKSIPLFQEYAADKIFEMINLFELRLKEILK